MASSTNSLWAFEKPRVAGLPSVAEPAEARDCLQAYRSELDYLIGSLRRLRIPASDIEDVLHEVFLVMLRRWDDYDPSRPLRPWLFAIAFRVASGHRRRNARGRFSERAEAADTAAQPDEVMASKQDRLLLLRALSALPLQRRAVLIMREIDQVPMRDIAEQLGIPLFTAYSRLRKARHELDAALITTLKRGAHVG